MQFDTVVKERKSVRKFKSKKVNWRNIIEAVESALQIPLAGNIPNLKFIIVSDGDLIKKIAKSCQQDFILQASHVVVVCNDFTDVVRSYDKEGEKYARQQAGAAIEQFLLKLVDLGLSGCWVGAFVEEQIKHTLEIPENVELEALIPIGYSIDKSPKKRKPSLGKSLYFDKYKNKLMKPIKQVEAF